MNPGMRPIDKEKETVRPPEGGDMEVPMKNVNAMASVKRFMAVFMTLVLLAGLLPVSVLAAEPVTDEDTFETAVSEGGTVKIDSSVDELDVDYITVSKDTTIVLNEQTLIGNFYVKPDVTLTIKGKGSLEGQDCLFTGRGTVVIDLDGEVSAPALTDDGGYGDVVSVVLQLKRGVFSGDITLMEGMTFADCIVGDVCKIGDTEYTGENIPEEVPTEKFAVLDKTAPVITAGNAERQSDTAATVTFASNEEGTYSYAVADGEGQEIIAQTEAADMVVGTNTVSIDALVDGDMKLSLWAKDYSGNAAPVKEITLPDYVAYTLTLPASEGFTTDPTGTREVQGGEPFSFRVTPAEGYEIRAVKWGDEILTETDGKYTIASVAESGTVEITAAKKQYKITVEAAVEQDEDLDAAGVIFKDSEGNPFDPTQTKVDHGEALVFTLELAEGYHTNDGKAPSIGINSNDYDLTNGIYTVESVTRDLLIRVFNVEKKTYTVAKPTGDGFTFTGEDTVKHGEDYTFTVTANEGYENLKVAVNGTEITAVEGVYTASACKKAPEITVTVSKSKLAVTAEGEGFTLDPESAEIEYGGSYTFAVKPAEGYEVGESGLTVTANGTALTETEGKYTAENITAATVIKVEGMVKRTYTVTLPTGDGFTVTADSGSNTVTHGEDFAFTVTVDSTNGYVQSPDFAVKVGDTVLTGENGRYTIPAVTGDQTVSVSGVSLSSFNIQVSTGGYSITAMTGSKNPAPYGSSYKFKLELKPGYMKTADFAVKANGTPLTADSSGVYTVENIRAHTTIEIFGVSNGSYNITFSSDASYKVTAVNSSLPVAYNGSYSFKVEPNPGYVRGNAFSVKQDGLAMSPDANGVYTIYNIQQNHSVSVTGVVAASTAVSYSVTLSGGTGYSYTAQNGSASPVAPGGSYSFKVNLAQGYTKGTNFAVKVNGYALSANNNGVYTISNINANQTVTVTGVIKSNTAGGGTTVPAAPAVTTATLPNGAMGTAYSQTLKANGQNITWSHNGTLPNGLTLNTTTGVISGTPTLNGTFRFSVKATNNAGSNTRQLTITITGEEYKISDGQKAQWTQGGEEGVLFRTDSKSQFVKVQVDGKDVAARYVETADNGASVTLKPDYLEDLDNGAHTLTIVYSDGSAKTTFTVAAEDKSEPPTIAVQPESQTADSGDKISFTVMANGTTPLICQWQVDKNDGNGWQNITGAVNASYTVTADTVHNGYKFRCTVTNSAGSATSEEAVLTVNGAEAPAGDEGETPDAPNTVGKKSNKWLWITVAGVAAAGIAAAGVIVYRNRKFYKD